LRTQKKNVRLWLLMILVVAIVLPVGVILFFRLEGQPPEITVELTPPVIGISKEVTVSFADPKSGIRRVWVGLLKDGKETVLAEKTFPFSGVIRGGVVREDALQLTVEPQLQGFADGEATLRFAVWDFAWRDWLRGNRTYVEKTVQIDTQPPSLDVLSRAHNVSQGGTGVVVYRTSEPCLESGVQVGDNFFPGHAGAFKDPAVHLAFFALGYDQGADTPVLLTATDLGGNRSQSGFPHYLRNKKFRQDTLQITDRFLNWKMPEFDTEPAVAAAASMKEKFLIVNDAIRQANFKVLGEVGRSTEKAILWEGSFLRLPNSARRAGFADHRVYQYGDQIIDRQVHMGIDLASVAHAPVPAANSGKVVFAEPLGIYGRTVMIDHGFGLFSLYSHLNNIAVQTGQQVKKGDLIGHTGVTGLAGGDHLHFGMMVHNTFIDPVEWWDPAWIKNNVTDKIDTVASGLK
jgi:murein DD-endopeptidase MepM/ murein hydrolase activator NlpD